MNRNEEEKINILMSLNETRKQNARKRTNIRVKFENDFSQMATSVSEHFQSIPDEIKNVSYLQPRFFL